jgi:hypothetical protein
MSKFVVEIETDGQAFREEGRSVELSNILHRLADRLYYCNIAGGPLTDSDGNRCGKFGNG